MAKTFEEIVAEEESKFKTEGPRITPSAPGAELDLSDITAPIPVPALREVKGRIAERGTLTEELAGISELRIDPLSRGIENPLLRGVARAEEIPLEIAMRGVAATGTAIKATESGISSALLAGIEGKPETMVDEFIQGVTGQKQTQIGDLIRATGIGGEKFNEPIAAMTGFMATLGLTNLASAGKIGQGANMVRQSLRRQAVKGAKKKAFFFRDQAQAFAKGFDDAFSNMRGEFDSLYKKIGNKVVSGDDAISLQDAVTSMPKDVASKITKIKGVNFLDKSQRILQPTVNNAKIVKDQISRTIPRNVWNGVDDGGANAELYRQMKDSYFKLNDVIANNAGTLRPKLLNLNARYKSLNTFSEKLQPFFTTKAGLVKTTIRNVRSAANEDARKQLIRFSNRFFKDGNVVLKDIDKMNKSISFQKGVKSVAQQVGPVAAGGAVAGGVTAGLLRKPISRITGGGGAPSGGGGG